MIDRRMNKRIVKKSFKETRGFRIKFLRYILNESRYAYWKETRLLMKTAYNRYK